jgi:hypothetical protein
LPKNISSPIHLGCLHYEGGRGTSWGHTQMTQPTITGTEPTLVEVLVGDPLSEVTRKTRLYLLAVSLIGVAMVTTGLVPTKIATFGIELEQPNRSALLILIALVNLYFLAAFIIYAVSDYMKRIAQVEAARERSYSALRFQLAGYMLGMSEDAVRRRYSSGEYPGHWDQPFRTWSDSSRERTPIGRGDDRWDAISPIGLSKERLWKNYNGLAANSIAK